MKQVESSAKRVPSKRAVDLTDLQGDCLSTVLIINSSDTTNAKLIKICQASGRDTTRISVLARHLQCEYDIRSQRLDPCHSDPCPWIQRLNPMPCNGCCPEPVQLAVRISHLEFWRQRTRRLTPKRRSCGAADSSCGMRMAHVSNEYDLEIPDSTSRASLDLMLSFGTRRDSAFAK